MGDHVIVLTIEASAEVTPAPTTDTPEAEPREDDEELNDG